MTNFLKSTSTTQWLVRRNGIISVFQALFTWTLTSPDVRYTRQPKITPFHFLLHRFYLFSNRIAWTAASFSNMRPKSIGRSVIQTAQVYNMQLLLITGHMPCNNRWQIITSDVISLNHFFFFFLMQSGFKGAVAADWVTASGPKFLSLFYSFSFLRQLIGLDVKPLSLSLWQLYL